MVYKASLKKIIDIIQWIVSIAVIGMGIYYFFISKDISKGMGLLIMWGGIGINSALSIINAKYFKENFSWKNNWANITQVCMCSVFIVADLILNYLY
ncbi:hypothetical protein [Clostridium tagluense]|uniref:Uncharacterized protein n=1 Tax=Clostridium tagluense TaxID=360422 RepID=A0A401UUH0_9CLOT|nr:hypothetical protein [Clostridium tagluense]GCD13144.1 hypothetical protein Ctaglu_47670 [Clostridium tagluense]